MKKFDPKKELNKKYKKNVLSLQFVNQMSIPLLVVCCLSLALLGISFSSSIAMKTNNKFYVKIDVIDGDVSSYSKIVSEGSFADTFTSSYDYGTIECERGSLSYDPLTSLVSGYIRSNTVCTLIFEKTADKALSVSLPSIYDNFGTSYYYKADAVDNYIMVNNMMFRIVRENGDGTLRVMLNETILSSDYAHYYRTLMTWYNTNFLNKPYVVERDFDIINYEDYDAVSLVNLDEYMISGVGLLSIREADIILDGVSKSYFDTYKGMYLANMSVDDAWAYKDGMLIRVNPSTVLALKPVINIDVTVTSGDGTLNNPYRFEDK